MKRFVTLVMFFFFLIHNVSADSVRLVFPPGSTSCFGVSPKMPNKDRMINFALEQASIFAAKLDRSFCIFRMATLEQTYGGLNDGRVASFIVNVIAEWDDLEIYLRNFKHIGDHEYKGYQIYFFNFVEKEPCIMVIEHDDEIELSDTCLMVIDGVVISTATARHRYLDEALDEAYKIALSEISKYQDINVKTMHRGIDYFSELATLLSSENVVSDVRFYEVDIRYSILSNLGGYNVKVSLIKHFPKGE